MKRNFLFILMGILAALIWIVGCNNDYPPSVWNDDTESLPKPVVNSITPQDSTWTSVGVITIDGQNFLSEVDKNVVYFNTTMLNILSASPTQLVLASPANPMDSIDVRVAVVGAFEFSDIVHYKVKPTVAEWGKFNADDLMYGLAADQAGNVYVSIAKNVIKQVEPDANVVIFSETGFLKANYMAFGPDGLLYATVEAGRVKKVVRFDMGTGAESDFKNLSKKPKGLDFDADGNLWVATEKDIVSITPAGVLETKKTMAVELSYLKVYDNSVYVSTLNETTGENKIWQIPINPDGSLGTEVLFFDAADGSWPAGIKVLCYAFDNTGSVFLGTNATTNPIRVWNLASGEIQALFDGLIPGKTVYEVAFGTGPFMYAVQHYFDSQGVLTSTKIIKIDTEAKRVM